MWIVRLALRRPYTFVVMSMMIVILGILATFRMPTDIFPEIDIPVVSVIWSYAGISPEEMAEVVTIRCERSFTTSVNDIEHMESQSLPGLSIIKIFFHPNAKVEAAVAQLAAASQAVLHSLPTGMTPPSILRYNASSVPILQMSISSDTMSESSLYDYGYNFIRTQMATVQGASFPLPYGGRPRQIMVDIDLKALYAQGLSANDVVNAVNAQSLIIPSGIAKIGPNEFVARLKRVCLRPFLRAVQNTVDFDNLFGDAINRQKRKAGKHKLARARLAAWTATAWKLRESAQCLVDSEGHAAGGFPAVMLLSVIANVCEIAGGGFGPPDAHQPRYRLLINLPMSSWSMSSPRSAAAIPFSTSRRNHSSWSTKRSTASCTRVPASLPRSAASRSSLACRSGLRFTSMPQG